jgi:hypothetical protein
VSSYLPEKKTTAESNCLPSKEAFGSYCEPLLFSAASVYSMAVYSLILIIPQISLSSP